MKEAAIKAHTYRYHKLSMTQVSVLRCGAKVTILIDPPCATITMDARIASLRELKHSRLSRISRIQSNASENSTGDLYKGTTVDSGKTYERSALIKEEDRQVAEGSISHDGRYVIAMCLALNESREHSDNNTGAIIDDGFGDPIHEPIWGDHGFLETEGWDDLKVAALLLNKTKRPGARSALFSGTRTLNGSHSKNPESRFD